MGGWPTFPLFGFFILHSTVGAPLLCVAKGGIPGGFPGRFFSGLCCTRAWASVLILPPRAERPLLFRGGWLAFAGWLGGRLQRGPEQAVSFALFGLRPVARILASIQFGCHDNDSLSLL